MRGLLNCLGLTLRGPGTPRSGGRESPPHAGCARGVPSAGARAFCLREDAGAPRGWGGSSPRPALGHPHHRPGAPLRLREPVSEKVLGGPQFPASACFFRRGRGRALLSVCTQRRSLEVGCLDACRWRALANVEQSRVCWHFCFLSLSSPGV